MTILNAGCFAGWCVWPVLKRPIGFVSVAARNASTGGESSQSGGIRLLAEQQRRRAIINDLINTCAECRSLENSSTLTNTEPKPTRPLPLNTSLDSRDTREKPGFYARLFPYGASRDVTTTKTTWRLGAVTRQTLYIQRVHPGAVIAFQFSDNGSSS